MTERRGRWSCKLAVLGAIALTSLVVLGIGACAEDDGTTFEDPEEVLRERDDGFQGDLDCPDLAGSVEVGQSDPFDLDRDNNGIGCEWGPDGEPGTGDEGLVPEP